MSSSSYCDDSYISVISNSNTTPTTSSNSSNSITITRICSNVTQSSYANHQIDNKNSLVATKEPLACLSASINSYEQYQNTQSIKQPTTNTKQEDTKILTKPKLSSNSKISQTTRAKATTLTKTESKIESKAKAKTKTESKVQAESKVKIKTKTKLSAQERQEQKRILLDLARDEEFDQELLNTEDDLISATDLNDENIFNILNYTFQSTLISRKSLVVETSNAQTDNVKVYLTSENILTPYGNDESELSSKPNLEAKIETKAKSKSKLTHKSKNSDQYIDLDLTGANTESTVDNTAETTTDSTDLTDNSTITKTVNKESKSKSKERDDSDLFSYDTYKELYDMIDNYKYKQTQLKRKAKDPNSIYHNISDIKFFDIEEEMKGSCEDREGREDVVSENTEIKNQDTTNQYNTNQDKTDQPTPITSIESQSKDSLKDLDVKELLDQHLGTNLTKNKKAKTKTNHISNTNYDSSSNNNSNNFTICSNKDICVKGGTAQQLYQLEQYLYCNKSHTHDNTSISDLLHIREEFYTNDVSESEHNISGLEHIKDLENLDCLEHLDCLDSLDNCSDLADLDLDTTDLHNLLNTTTFSDVVTNVRDLPVSPKLQQLIAQKIQQKRDLAKAKSPLNSALNNTTTEPVTVNSIVTKFVCVNNLTTKDKLESQPTIIDPNQGSQAKFKLDPQDIITDFTNKTCVTSDDIEATACYLHMKFADGEISLNTAQQMFSDCCQQSNPNFTATSNLDTNNSEAHFIAGTKKVLNNIFVQAEYESEPKYDVDSLVDDSVNNQVKLTSTALNQNELSLTNCSVEVVGTNSNFSSSTNNHSNYFEYEEVIGYSDSNFIGIIRDDISLNTNYNHTKGKSQGKYRTNAKAKDKNIAKAKENEKAKANTKANINAIANIETTATSLPIQLDSTNILSNQAITLSLPNSCLRTNFTGKVFGTSIEQVFNKALLQVALNLDYIVSQAQPHSNLSPNLASLPNVSNLSTKLNTKLNATNTINPDFTTLVSSNSPTTTLLPSLDLHNNLDTINMSYKELTDQDLATYQVEANNPFTLYNLAVTKHLNKLQTQAYKVASVKAKLKSQIESKLETSYLETSNVEESSLKTPYLEYSLDLNFTTDLLNDKNLVDLSTNSNSITTKNNDFDSILISQILADNSDQDQVNYEEEQTTNTDKDQNKDQNKDLSKNKSKNNPNLGLFSLFQKICKNNAKRENLESDSESSKYNLFDSERDDQDFDQDYLDFSSINLKNKDNDNDDQNIAKLTYISKLDEFDEFDDIDIDIDIDDVDISKLDINQLNELDLDNLDLDDFDIAEIERISSSDIESLEDFTNIPWVKSSADLEDLDVNKLEFTKKDIESAKRDFANSDDIFLSSINFDDDLPTRTIENYITDEEYEEFEKEYAADLEQLDLLFNLYDTHITKDQFKQTSQKLANKLSPENDSSSSELQATVCLNPTLATDSTASGFSEVLNTFVEIADTEKFNQIDDDKATLMDYASLLGEDDFAKLALFMSETVNQKFDQKEKHSKNVDQGDNTYHDVEILDEYQDYNQDNNDIYHDLGSCLLNDNHTLDTDKYLYQDLDKELSSDLSEEFDSDLTKEINSGLTAELTLNLTKNLNKNSKQDVSNFNLNNEIEILGYHDGFACVKQIKLESASNDLKTLVEISQFANNQSNATALTPVLTNNHELLPIDIRSLTLSTQQLQQIYPHVDHKVFNDAFSLISRLAAIVEKNEHGYSIDLKNLSNFHFSEQYTKDFINYFIKSNHKPVTLATANISNLIPSNYSEAKVISDQLALIDSHNINAVQELIHDSALTSKELLYSWTKYKTAELISSGKFIDPVKRVMVLLHFQLANDLALTNRTTYTNHTDCIDTITRLVSQGKEISNLSTVMTTSLANTNLANTNRSHNHSNNHNNTLPKLALLPTKSVTTKSLVTTDSIVVPTSANTYTQQSEQPVKSLVSQLVVESKEILQQVTSLTKREEQSLIEPSSNSSSSNRSNDSNSPKNYPSFLANNDRQQPESDLVKVKLILDIDKEIYNSPADILLTLDKIRHPQFPSYIQPDIVRDFSNINSEVNNKLDSELDNELELEIDGNKDNSNLIESSDYALATYEQLVSTNNYNANQSDLLQVIYLPVSKQPIVISDLNTLHYQELAIDPISNTISANNNANSGLSNSALSNSKSSLSNSSFSSNLNTNASNSVSSQLSSGQLIAVSGKNSNLGSMSIVNLNLDTNITKSIDSNLVIPSRMLSIVIQQLKTKQLPIKLHPLPECLPPHKSSTHSSKATTKRTTKPTTKSSVKVKLKLKPKAQNKGKTTKSESKSSSRNIPNSKPHKN